MKNTKKMNNKGFSLVELIIVVAIMAVLIAVLAPQYLKHVETARQSADLDNYQSIISAVQVYYADPTHTTPTAGSYTVTFGTTGAFDSTSAASQITNALSDSGVNAGGITMKSNAYKTATLKMTVDANGKYTFTTTNTTLASALGIGSYTATP